MKLTLALIISGLLIIVTGLMHDRSHTKSLRAHQTWLAADAATTAERNRDEAMQRKRQYDAIERISDRRQAEIAVQRVEEEWRQKRAELWKPLLPGSAENRAAEAAHLEQREAEDAEAEKQQLADDVAHEKAVREFKSKLGQ